MLFAVEPMIAAEIEYRRERAHDAWGTRSARRRRSSSRTSRTRTRLR